MLKTKNRWATFSLVTITAVWGLTFPLIKGSVKSIPPFTFVSLRFWIGALFILMSGRVLASRSKETSGKRAGEFKAGAILGLALFAGYSLQTVGLQFTSASNGGFLTALSVILVPMISLLSGHRIGAFSWAGISLSVIGVAFLTLTSSFVLNSGDLLMIGCAIAFAIHIVLVGKYSSQFDPVKLAFIQVFICAILAGIASLIFERDQTLNAGFETSALGSMVFCGVGATGIAYLVQNMAQRYSSPVKTALIFTCEPVFGAIFSAWYAGEVMSHQQVIGGVLMILAMILAEAGPQIWGALMALKLNPRASDQER